MRSWTRQPQLLGRLAAGGERLPRWRAWWRSASTPSPRAEHAALDPGVDERGLAVAAHGAGGVAGGDALAQAVGRRVDPHPGVDPAHAVDEHDARRAPARRATA